MKARFQSFLESRRLVKCRLREDRGSALLEAALSVTLILTLLFGVIEICLGLYSYHFISNAAREGTRYAIVRGSTWQSNCADYSSAGCAASQANIESYVQSLAFPGIDASNIVVTPTWSATLGGSSCTTCNAAGDYIKIQVQYTFPLVVPFIPSHSLNMSSTSEMIIDQ